MIGGLDELSEASWGPTSPQPSPRLTPWVRSIRHQSPKPSRAYGANHTSFQLPPADVFEEDVRPQCITGPIPEAQALLRVLLQQFLTEVLAGLAELVRVLDGL